MTVVRNLQLVNDLLCYRGYTIEQSSGIGEERYGSYIWTEYEAYSTFDFTIVEGTLESLLDTIDYRLDNNLTGKRNIGD